VPNISPAIDTSAPLRPRLKLPPGSCDTHLHVYDPRFTHHPKRVPPVAPASAYRALQQRLGLERAIIVQPTHYGDDNSCTLDAIATLGLYRTRGVAVITEAIDDAELERLTKRGIRGVRFFLVPDCDLRWDQIDRLAAQVQPWRWHAQVQLLGFELPDREAALKRLPGRLVIDHMGRFHGGVSIDHPAFKTLQRLVDTGRVWVKLSAPYPPVSAEPLPYPLVGRMAKALVKQAPERCLWGSNWPHPGADAPDEALLLDLMLDWAPDESTRNRIFVTNPAELYGF
jgi:D-galactarolactone isomerase